MNISFSHKYYKLWHHGTGSKVGGAFITEAVLLDVFIVNIEECSKAFLDYDTDDGLFELPKKGKYMVLLFKKFGMPDLFTTIRRWTPEKEKWYRSGIGNTFDVKFKPGI
jgi:hypothetical protein